MAEAMELLLAQDKSQGTKIIEELEELNEMSKETNEVSKNVNNL